MTYNEQLIKQCVENNDAEIINLQSLGFSIEEIQELGYTR